MNTRQFPRFTFIVLVLTLLLMLSLAGCGSPPIQSPSSGPTSIVTIAGTPSPSIIVDTAGQTSAKNVILLIGDGMGLSQITLGRLYAGNKPLTLDSIDQVGTVSTYPTGSPKWITDSAAAGTALACGVKTYIGAIGVDADKKTVPNILELAKQGGKATGVISTMRITNATPACFTAHDDSRRDETDIALDQLALQPDIMMGGGLDMFLPKEQGGARQDARDLTAELRSAGYTFVTDDGGLQKASGKILGLFASGPMPYEIDRENGTPTLAAMTQKALSELSKNEKGFFIMVEGGRIDPACHAHDAATAGCEVVAFDQAVQAALDFAQKDGLTLVIVTADHETAGVGLGSDSQPMVFNYALLKGQKSSIFEVVSKIDFKAATPPDFGAILQDSFGLKDVTAQEKQALLDAYTKEKAGTSGATNKAFSIIMSARISIGFTAGEHTDTDVMVFSFGPGNDGLGHHIDNTDIFKCMKAVMGV